VIAADQALVVALAFTRRLGALDAPVEDGGWFRHGNGHL
jgi:hypothetical protein